MEEPGTSAEVMPYVEFCPPPFALRPLCPLPLCPFTHVPFSFGAFTTP
jgi:hypothetical protein